MIILFSQLHVMFNWTVTFKQQKGMPFRVFHGRQSNCLEHLSFCYLFIFVPIPHTADEFGSSA